MLLPRFNLANRVTLARLALALVVFAVLFVIEGKYVDGDSRASLTWVGIAFFIVATTSDALDGYIARRDNTVTAFGRIADPFVDKVIVCGCLVFLAAIPDSQNYLKPWMVALILIREFLVNGIRGYMESQGVSFAAEMPGKIKMVLQSFLIGFLMGVIACDGNPPAWMHHGSVLLLWSTLGLTVWSGWLYVVKAGKHLGASEI